MVLPWTEFCHKDHFCGSGHKQDKLENLGVNVFGLGACRISML